MENEILKNIILGEGERKIESSEQGPVITISRDFGCYASHVAQLLAAKLSELSLRQPGGRRWTYITTEVLDEAAHNLKVDKNDISHVFGANERNFFRDLMDSFSSKKYTSDSNIKMAITKVVKSYAEQGNVIIVGRAGCVIAKHIQRSLHVKITAPMDWRVHRTSERLSINDHEARKMVSDIDEKRRLFMSFFKGDIPESNLFDITLNRSKIAEADIVDCIMYLAKSKELV